VQDWLTTLATTQTPAQQQLAVSRAFLLIVVMIIIGILIVIGMLMAGFAWFAKNSSEKPERKDRFKGVDAWTESARRTEVENEPPPPDEDWEADEDEPTL